jgi:hypothetical protein
MSTLNFPFPRLFKLEYQIQWGICLGRVVKLAWAIAIAATQTFVRARRDWEEAIAFSKKRSAPIIFYKVHIINAPQYFVIFTQYPHFAAVISAW